LKKICDRSYDLLTEKEAGRSRQKEAMRVGRFDITHGKYCFYVYILGLNMFPSRIRAATKIKG